MLKFPEMPYERPDIEAAKQFLAEAAARLEAAESFEAADAVFVEVNERSTQLDTMFTTDEQLETVCFILQKHCGLFITEAVEAP